MGDPYYRYGGLADRGSVGRPSFPGYMLSEAPVLDLGSTDLRGASSDFLQKEINPSRPGAYGLDDIAAIGIRPEPGLSGVAVGATRKGYSSPLDDSSLVGQRRDVALGINPGIPDIDNERTTSLKNVDGHQVSAGKSNVLFVDGLPTDCTRREVGHLFRPFIGYKDIRVVHKEPRHSGDKALVLCFVEFIDSECALTALEALQGYKFDDKKPDSPALRILFAHFPFRLPSDSDDPRIGITH